MGNEARSPQPSQTGEAAGAEARRSIFLFDLAVVGGLFLIAWSYVQPPDSSLSPLAWLGLRTTDLVPEALRLPLFALWFGALGGIMISLKGVYDHSPKQWEHRYNLWHFGRPISGGIAGAITYLLLITISGASPVEPTILVAAFVMGTQERRFFNFLYEVARLVVQVPGDTQDAPLVVESIRPQAVQPGAEVIVLGRGFEPGVRVRAGQHALQDVVVSRDGNSITGLAPLGPQQGGEVDVLVANPSGAARLLAGALRYPPAAPPADRRPTPAAPLLRAVSRDGRPPDGAPTLTPARETRTEQITAAGGAATAAPSAPAMPAPPVGLPAVRAEPPALDFGAQPLAGTGAVRTIHLVNGGDTSLAVRRVSFVGSRENAFSLLGELPVDAELAPGEAWKLKVQFRPETPGAHEAVLYFQTREGEPPVTSLLLSGAGAAPAA